MIFYGIITEIDKPHRRFSYAKKFWVINESALEKSDHWDTTEKTIIHGGISTREVFIQNQSKQKCF